MDDNRQQLSCDHGLQTLGHFEIFGGQKRAEMMRLLKLSLQFSTC